MSANLSRTLIGKTRTMTSRAEIYQTADGLEIESYEQYEVVQRRVLFDDVQMVSIHREAGVAYLVLTGFFAIVFLGIGIVILNVSFDAWPAALIFGIVGFPALVAFFVRLFLGVDVITIFGRRSKANLRYTIRKQRAREMYGTICATVRNAHRMAERAMAASAPAQQLPDDVPQPPRAEPEQGDEQR